MKKCIKNFLKEHAPQTWYLLKSLKYEFARMRIYKRSEIKNILFECWGDFGFDFHPKDRRMGVLEEKGVSGMNTENIRFLINEVVRRFAKNGAYLEVGTLKGSSLLSAALFNPSTRCIGIDNFSKFDSEGKNESILKNNIQKFDNPKNIEFYNMDYKEGLKHLFSKEPDLKVNVYYYDGSHKYEDQSDGLKMLLPYLAEKCVILVDDINWEWAEKANTQFLSGNPYFKSVFKIKTKTNGAIDWWNGFQVITRGI